MDINVPIRHTKSSSIALCYRRLAPILASMTDKYAGVDNLFVRKLKHSAPNTLVQAMRDEAEAHSIFNNAHHFPHNEKPPSLSDDKEATFNSARVRVEKFDVSTVI